MATKTASKRTTKQGSPSQPESSEAPPAPTIPVDYGDLTEEQFQDAMRAYQTELSEGRNITTTFAAWVENRLGWMHMGGRRFQIADDTPAMEETGESYRPNEGKAAPDKFA